MILQYINTLSAKNIVLASSSPRRKEILQKIGLRFTITASNFAETLDPSKYPSPSQFVIATAEAKAEKVAQPLDQTCETGLSTAPDLVIGADTCISFEGQVYGKPKSPDDAIQMLSRFSGCSHEVVTGVCLLVRTSSDQTWEKVCFSETTEVQFADLTLEEIQAYVDTGEPMDKAGGYGIQGMGGCLVEGIKGDYYNVMGFPLHRFCKYLHPVLVAGDGLTS